MECNAASHVKRVSWFNGDYRWFSRGTRYGAMIDLWWEVVTALLLLLASTAQTNTTMQSRSNHDTGYMLRSVCKMFCPNIVAIMSEARCCTACASCLDCTAWIHLRRSLRYVGAFLRVCRLEGDSIIESRVQQVFLNEGVLCCWFATYLLEKTSHAAYRLDNVRTDFE